MPEKSIIVTYVLWLFGGIFGVHHFYLNRNFNGCVWSLTMGGFFFGLIYDIFNIPSYVQYANDDTLYMEKLNVRCSFRKPKLSYSRLFLTIELSSLISISVLTTFNIYFKNLEEYGVLIVSISTAIGY